ncbi:hypothetical protein ACET3Z_014978 [Daucus carota]
MGSSGAANLWVLLGLGIAGLFIMTKKIKKTIKADFGAFVERFQLLPPPQPAPPKAPHPLTGFSFAVSDIFDIDGHVTGFGNPDWARTHEAASQTSPVVLTLVEGGSTCVGKTVVDEMTFSISGENKHYDTPTNPAAPARVPGGSSSGAAVAVAANLVDFSLGVDVVGDVRIPAGFCGVLGFRPSHGAVSHTGIIPVASSLEAVGWFAKDPKILGLVGHVLLQLPFGVQRNPRSVLIADDCFELLKTPVSRITESVVRSTEKLLGKQVLKHMNIGEYISSKVPSLQKLNSNKANGEQKPSSLKLLAHTMQLLWRHEFKNNHGEWITSERRILDTVVTAQLHDSPDITDSEIENIQKVRNDLKLALNALLKDDAILVIPSVLHPPPKLGAKEISSEDYLTRTYSLMSLASMSGCCQVTIPMGFQDKSPVSVSFIARHGGDRFLLDTTKLMHASLQEQAEAAGKSNLSSNVVSREASAEIAKEKGNQAYKEKQFKRAVDLYSEAIKLNGNNATYYSNRAAAHLEAGSYLKAEADCTKAIDLDKKNVKSYLRRGTARELLGYFDGAIEDFKYALVLEPTNKRASTSADRLIKLFH